MYNRTPLDIRIALQSRPDKATGCILWTGTTNFGYGILNAFGKMMKAHRVAWILRNGDIPAGMCVCHRCDVRACINPEHLFLGTQADNMHDMAMKGRSAKNSGLACLTQNQILEIRSDKRPSREVAADYGVSHVTIQKARRGANQMKGEAA